MNYLTKPLYGHPYFICVVLLLSAITPLTGEHAFAQDPSVNSLITELTEDADAVVRYDQQKFEINGPGKGRIQVYQMITILNKDGLIHANIEIPYNSFSKIRNLNGAIYDAEGERVRRLRSRDFDDESMVSSYSIAEDSRKKTANLVHHQYPFTIELDYSLDLSGFIQPPAWIPIPAERTGLQFASLEIQVAPGMELDYRVFNISDENFEKSYMDGKASYKWILQQIPAVEREIMGPPWTELFPALVFRTSEFSMDGYSGSLNSWEDFAQWIGNLWQGRDELPDDVKERVNELKKEMGMSKGLIHALYREVQKNTRYVSVQLGIGGFQTEFASVTARNKYGDCKALSNYLMGMLRHAGFEAYPALIRNGSFLFPFDPEFVHDPFNHVVIVVPFEGENIWVEATSSLYPAGYLGSSNMNRKALVFKGDSGELIDTPRSEYTDNFQIRNAEVDLDDDGDAFVRVDTRYGGSQHERIRYIAAQRDGNRVNAIRDMVPFNLFNILNEEILADSLNPEATAKLEFDISSFSNKLGSRLMFNPNLMERSGSYLPAIENREQHVFIRNAYHDVDEIVYTIPDTYKIEAVPAPVDLEFEYGKYSSSVTMDEVQGKLIYKREIFYKPGVLSPEEYGLIRDFVNESVRSDNNQVVLVADG
jgi:hypothetical protein